MPSEEFTLNSATYERIKIIVMNSRPIKAYDILDQLKRKDSSAKPITVYRALDFLLENGFVHKINSINAYFPCIHPLEHNECYFFLCNKCGKINEICDSNTDQVIKSLKYNKHFVVKKYT